MADELSMVARMLEEQQKHHRELEQLPVLAALAAAVQRAELALVADRAGRRQEELDQEARHT